MLRAGMVVVLLVLVIGRMARSVLEGRLGLYPVGLAGSRCAQQRPSLGEVLIWITPVIANSVARREDGRPGESIGVRYRSEDDE